MKKITYIKLSILSMLISSAFVCWSNLEHLGRKETLDYQAFYTGTKQLETERLILRQITLEDAEDMFKFTSNFEVETWDPVDQTSDDTRRFISCLLEKYEAKEPTLWGIADKSNNKLIGYCGFTFIQSDSSIVELEYALDKPHWHKGLMPEALEAIMAFTFTILKINRIMAFTVLTNERSQKVLLKMGMKFEGLHREAGYSQGVFCDLNSYALVRQDYLMIQKKLS